MKDYRIQVRVRNGRILSRIEEAGFPSIKAFCKHYNLSYERVVNLTAMKVPALLKQSGQWKEFVFDLAGCLKCDPEDLFNDRQARAAFAVTSGSFDTDDPTISIEDLRGMPSALPSPETECIVKDAITRALPTLTAREERVLRMRYGIGGHGEMTLEEISEELGRVSKERIRQIEMKALRKMKHPRRGLGAFQNGGSHSRYSLEH